MSLWRWLGLSRPVTYEPDRVWLTRQGALAGLVRDAVQWLFEDASVVVVAHFPATLAEVEKALDTASVAWRACEGPLAGPEVVAKSRAGEGGSVLLVPAPALRTDLPPVETADRSRAVTVLAVERHPLRSHDERIETFAATIPFRTRLTFYLSLEDPLLKRFAGGWVEATLRRLGMAEDESVTSPLVTRRIKRAQTELQRATPRDEPAESAEEWYARNAAEE